ncbi:MAG: HD-GYP domain-containing protein [Bacillota bacterium]|nr:HD-GYP domain-containing protein [Bacillota bacterium]
MAAVSRHEPKLPGLVIPEFELEDRVITALMHVLYEKSPREEGHSRRVSQLCFAIGAELGMEHDDRIELAKVGLLHDIGKISIPSEILNKSQPLLPWEWKEIHGHPINGHRFLSAVVGMAEIAEATLAHHERMDGTGYPYGRRGQQIPFMARIVAVADAYDAMVSARPYRHAYSHSQALQELQRGAGKQFDAQVVKAFTGLACREIA